METGTNPIEEKKPYQIELSKLKYQTEQIEYMDFRTLSEINKRVAEIIDENNTANNYKFAFNSRAEGLYKLIYSKSNSRRKLFDNYWKSTQDDLKDLVDYRIA
ncbi:MAG: hypothetical protein EOO06_00440 [Chitinophagaceae bacterium]|nr:MAG: hypothetical protein EOO06_00440 [Chitinophagaceae bacterium]